MENIEIPKRLAIFQCHDKDGIIDDYIPYLLRDLLENIEMLVIVVNGKLTAEGRFKLEKLTPHIFVRADEGFDAAAWKEAMINYLGWERIAGFDELILLNDTFFGPFYPFREIFEEMDQRSIDFWGLTAHAAITSPSNLCPYSYWPAHIQTYFIVIRKKMFSSYEFRHYWETQPLFRSKEELINRNEVVFTKHFEDAGFTWEVLCDASDWDGKFLDGSVINHYAFNTYELLTKRKYPVIKRLNFGCPYSDHLLFTSGSQLKKSMEYIDSHTGYDVSLIYQNILRVYNIADIFYNLHLIHILSKRYSLHDGNYEYRAAMVFHIGYIDMLEYVYPYISGLPKCVDVILTTKPEQNVEKIDQLFSPVLGSRLRVLCVKDRGQDLAALLVAAKNYLNCYDYIGFCHDKKLMQSEPMTVGSGVQDLIIENTIGSAHYVENILDFLERHSEVGFLSPPPPNHGSYFSKFGVRYWGADERCIARTKALAKRLGLTVDISKDKWPLAIGTAFWCRREALAPLFDYPWTYEDFPPEPLPADGTLNHAMERILPFVAQQQGYLSGWVMTDEYASLEITNIHYRLTQVLLSGDVDSIGLRGALVRYVKKHLPKPLWGIARKIKRLLRW